MSGKLNTPIVSEGNPSTPRWTPRMTPGADHIDIGDSLRLQWKVNGEDKPTRTPSCSEVTERKSRLLEIETVEGMAWTRLNVPLHRPKEKSIFTIRVLIRVVGINVDEGARLIPMLACKPDAEKTWLNPILCTKASPLSPLKAGVWHEMSGLFIDHTREGPDAASFLILNLSTPYQYQIAQLDVDWHKETADAQATDEGLEVLSPFQVQEVTPTVLPSWTTGAITSLASVMNELKTLPQDPKALGQALIMRAHTSTGSALLKAFLTWVDVDKTKAESATPQGALLATLFRRKMGPFDPRIFQNVDRNALKVIRQFVFQGCRFHPPRRLLLECGPKLLEAKGPWADMVKNAILELKVDADQADVTTQTLKVSEPFQMSELSIAFLRCSETACSHIDIVAKRLIEKSHTSWLNIISDYLETESDVNDVVKVASLSKVKGYEAAPLTLAMGEINPEILGNILDVEADNAFAFVINLGSDDDIANLINIKKCIVANSLQDLQALYPAPSPRLKAKPVVVVASPYHGPDYLIKAVEGHWANAGRNIISPIFCDYDAKHHKFNLRLVDHKDLSPLTFLHAITSLPLQDIHAITDPYSAFQPAEGFCVATPAAHLHDTPYLSLLERKLQSKPVALAQLEHLTSLGGELSYKQLLHTNQDFNWAVASIVSPRLIAHQNLTRDLKAFNCSEKSVSADHILSQIDITSPSIHNIAADLDTFVLHLSSNATLLAELENDNFIKYLSLVRQCGCLDAAAKRLMMIASQVLTLNTNYILPFLSVISCGLSRTEMDSVFIIGIGLREGQGRRYLNRLLSGCQRLGTPMAQSLMILSLYHKDKDILFEESIANKFGGVLTSDYSTTIQEICGSDIINRIHDTQSITHKFSSAVHQGNRDAAIVYLDDADAIEHEGFLDFFDKMRCLSNELRDLELSVDSINTPGIKQLSRRKIAAIILSDITALKDLQALDLLKYPDPLNAVALNILGDNSALNDIIDGFFTDQSYRPAHVTGDSTLAVFLNAQTSLEDLTTTQDGPLVSIIMSAFEPDIALMEAAINSLNHQTHQNIEILVVDDASSPEKSTEIATLVYRFDKARLLRVPVNSGPYVGRNLAISQAKGSFIAIHDADDWAHPQLLEAQIDIFNDAPEIRVVSANHIRIDQAGHVQLERDFVIFGDGPMTSMFRSSVFDEVGPFAEVRSRGDVEMRERLIVYYGKHAEYVLNLPLKFCFADSGTLSQITARDNAEFLQQWRTNIYSRRSLRHLRSTCAALDSSHQVNIPKLLRAPKLQGFS
jgi:hypothetical protein